MLPSETMIWQPEFTDKTLSRKPGAVQSVSLRIDTMLEQRIRKLATYVKKNDLQLTEFYFYDANWSFCGEDEIQEITDQDEYKHSDSTRQEAMLREVMPSARTECPVIRVMKDSFQLSALPRHCGDDMTLNTPSIPLSELKTNVTAFITPPTYI
ncbi:hypothetical protein ACRWDH_26260 [Escherichia coli]